MKGRIFITRTGYDPKLGKHIKDPYLGDVPSIGACQSKFRKKLKVGDHIFVITGKVNGANQLVLGGFEIAKKIDAIQAFKEYPERRLRKREDGQLEGNIIVDEYGHQHELDDHSNFDARISNYMVGKNRIVLETDEEIERGRDETLEALQDIFKKKGNRPIDIIGRGCSINEQQIIKLRDWLSSIRHIH